jgi:hypothetical protein
MRRTTLRTLLAFAIATAFAACGHASTVPEQAPKPAGHSFSVRYSVAVPAPADGGVVDIFIPIAQSDAWQEVAQTINASVSGRTGTEEAFGNGFWRTRVDETAAYPITIQVD